MKLKLQKLKRLSIILPSVVLFSCTSTSYYQVFKTESPQSTNNGGVLIFESDSVFFYYNLWAQGGDPGVSIVNKNKEDITIDLHRTFFVAGGYANPYYFNQSSQSVLHSSSTQRSTTTAGYYTFGNSLSVMKSEIERVIIPYNTNSSIHRFNIIRKFFLDCDLRAYPKGDQIKVANYSKDESPISFSNIITYYKGKDTLRVQHDFYVSQLKNVPEKEITERSYDGYCGKKKIKYDIIFSNPQPDSFYYKY